MVAGKNRVGSKHKRGRERQRESGLSERQSIGENQKWLELITDQSIWI
jgi:hypothetical protein